MEKKHEECRLLLEKILDNTIEERKRIWGSMYSRSNLKLKRSLIATGFNFYHQEHLDLIKIVCSGDKCYVYYLCKHCQTIGEFILKDMDNLLNDIVYTLDSMVCRKCDYSESVTDSNKNEPDFIVNTCKRLYPDIIVNITDKKVEYTCPQCGKQNSCNMNSFLKYASLDLVLYSGFCCHIERLLYMNGEKLVSSKKVVRNKFVYNDKGEKFERIDDYDAKCKNNHIFYLREYDRKNPHCLICEAMENIEFFKMLKELNIRFKIEDRVVGGRRRSFKKIKISNFKIMTGNEKGHLTGKIVFNDDSWYHEEIKADRNGLVFRKVTDYKHLDDRQWCLNFFNSFFEEIVRKNNLKK